MTASWVDVVLWGVACVAWGAAVVVLGWAVLWDRARGRRRCPRCWYDMTGVIGLRCPECGRSARSEQALKRTRRRGWMVVVALLLAGAAYVLGSVPSLREKGWRSKIPSAVLLTVWPASVKGWIAERVDGRASADAAVREVQKRIEGGKLRRWEVEAWMGRVKEQLRREGRLVTEEEGKVAEKLRAARITRSFDGTRLEEVVQELAKEIGVPIRVDWAALQPGPGKETTVTFALTRASGDEALEEMLSAAGWTAVSFGDWFVTEKGVVVTASAGQALALRVGVYDMRGTIDGLRVSARAHGWKGASDAEMGNAITAITMLCTRRAQSGAGATSSGSMNSSWQSIGHALIVAAPAWQQARTAWVLEALERSVRAEKEGMHVVEMEPDEWREAMWVSARLRGALVHVGAGRVRFGDLVGSVGDAAGATVHVDWKDPSWGRGVGEETMLTVEAGDYSAWDLLERITGAVQRERGVGAYWNIEHGTVEVQTWKRLQGHAHARIYHLGDVMDARLRAAGVVLGDQEAALRCFRDLIQKMEEGAGRVAIAHIGGYDLCQLFDWRVLVESDVVGHVKLEAYVDELRKKGKGSK